MGDSSTKLAHLLQCCPEAARPALKAKLHLIERERDDIAIDAYHRVRNEGAARRNLGSSVSAFHQWQGADRASDAAAKTTIAACFDLGVTDTVAVADYVGTSLREFLTAFATTRIRPEYGGVANELISKALAKQGRIKAMVTSMQYDHSTRQELPMKTINVAVHGGNVQVGDANSQTVTYQTFLTGLAAAVEQSPDLPAEKKTAWTATLRELAAHPLTQTLVAAAAGAATK